MVNDLKLYEKDFFEPSIVPQTEYLQSIIQFYEQRQLFEIVRLALGNFPENKIKVDNDKKFVKLMQWINQIIAFTITEEAKFLETFEEKEYHAKNFFKKSISIYISIIDRLEYLRIPTIEKNFFVQIIILQLSKAFHHEQFPFLLNDVIQALKGYLFVDNTCRDKTLATVLIQFCLGGAQKLKNSSHSDKVTDLINVIVDLIALKGFWKVDEIMSYQSKIQEFSAIKQFIIPKFDECFSNFLFSEFSQSAGDATESKSYFSSQLSPELYFFKSLIDDCGDDLIKRDAFSHIIKNLKYRSVLPKSDIHSVIKKWPTNFIKDHFLNWYSRDIKLIENNVINSDIFDLIYYGVEEIEDHLRTYAQEIILMIFQKYPIAIFKSLHIIGRFLFSQLEFAMSLSKQFADLTESLPSNTQNLGWLLAILNMLFELNAFKTEDKIRVLRKIESFEIPRENIHLHMSRTFLFYYVSHAQMFFDSFTKVLSKSDPKNVFEADRTLVEFYLSLATHVSKEPNFKSGFTLDKSTWNTLNDTTQASLLMIATSTNYFVENGDDACELLKIIDAKLDQASRSVNAEEKIAALNLLRTAILCGSDYSQYDGSLDNEESEHYITSKYVVSIVGRNKLVIRHPLGATSFMIYDKSESKAPAPIELPPVSESHKPEIKSSIDYSDLDENDAFTQEILKMNSVFTDATEFIPYQQPPEPVNESDVYSMLVDIGFLNYSQNEYVKRLPDGKMIQMLDESKFPRVIMCGILQIDQTNTKTNMYHCKNTKALQNLLGDLSNGKLGTYSTPLFQFNYNAPYDLDESKNPKNVVGNSSVVLLLNEDDSVIDMSTGTENKMFLIMVKPRGDYYELELINTKIDFFTPFPKDGKKLLPWFVHKSHIGSFIAMLCLAHLWRDESKLKVFLAEIRDRALNILVVFNKPNITSGLSRFARLRNEKPNL